MRRFALHLAGTFFGSGYAPIAPATAGSLLFTLMWWGAWTAWGPIGLPVHLAVLALVTAIGIPVAGALERIHGEDPKLVVIDEVAGMLVTFLGVTGGPLVWFAGFLWFRIFDILKPLGVRRLEQLNGGGGVGIMADDLGAGVLACAATHVTARLLAGWGL